MTFIYVAVSLPEVDKEVSAAIGSAWAPSTLRTRNSQWKRFISFCQENDLCPLPATPRTVSRFLVFQARSSKYVTVNNYLSAINRLHAFYGHTIDFRGFFLIKLVLAGIKRQLGDKSTQKIPLTPEQMINIHSKLDLSDDNIRSMWCALMLSFRSLLRKSNLVPDNASLSGHLIRRSDIEFTPTGMIIHVHSSKTLQYNDRVLDIPISTMSSPVFCVVTMMKEHFKSFEAGLEEPLFMKKSPKGVSPVLYADLLHFLKNCVSLIGLNPADVGLHSMRRSGAAFLHHIGTPLEDIRCIGDWRSLAVLSYLITPPHRMRDIEVKASTSLESVAP